MWLLDVHNLGTKMVSNSVESNLLWNIWFVWFKPRTLYNENWLILSHNLFLILWAFRAEKEQKITERLSMDGFILQGLNWIEVCKSESSVWYISDLEQYFCR